MNAERWQQIKTILETALGKDPGSLEQYLDKACADDSELRSEINSLIAMQEQAKNVSEIKAVNIIGKSFVKGITETNLTNNDENSEDILDSEIKIVDIHKSIIGRALGDFLVKEKLGEGGFGVVYKATQLTLEREVVIKVLHTRHSKNRNIIERFKREALLASRFEHPYCAHIYSFGAETDGLLWIAMEFVQGTPLNELLKAKGKLSLEKFVLLLNKICEVVHTAHEAGIIHRDLKPANVMVISRAGRLFPKLLDFGIAKGLNQNINLIDKSLSNFSVTENNNNFIEDNSNLTSDKLQVVTDNLNYLKSNFIEQEKETDANKPEATNPKAILSNTKAEWFQTQGFIGSPPYMSPEQWENGANVDARSDIYSLGVLAYQVIVGDLPFNEKGYQLYKAHASKPVPLLKEGFPIRLNEVLKKALAKKPEDRYQTALEFAKEFRDAADFNEQTVNLPQLDEILKEDLLANAPKPLADTIASLLASHNAYQFRDRVLLAFSVLIRYIGVLTLASYTSIANRVQDNELVNKSITTLCHKGLSESEWIELARELCRPFAKKRDAFAIAELVSLFFTDNSELLSPVNETFNNLLQLREKILFTMSVTEENLLDFLAEFVLKLTVLLKATCWLSDYYLVLPKGKQATKWMGRTGIAKDLGVISIKASILANDKATLVDAKGHFVLSLWPLIEIVEPTLGASQEVFLLEGKGYNGTKLVSFPYGFEIETEGSLEWLKEHFFTDEEKSHSELLLETSPYLGLATFSPEDSVLFFGREKETERFLNRLRLQPLLVVVGPSGAGKSSFIQAGVIARLIKNWKILTLRPGLSPLATLSTKLSTLGFEITDLKASLQKDISFLAKTLRRFAINNNNIILLVVDQFE